MEESKPIPFPKICPDCFHQECIDLLDAWTLLENDRQAHL